MKKTVQIAFAFTLVILSILSMVIHVEIFRNIIAAIIIPSFLLSLISFIDTIIVKCKLTTEAILKEFHESEGLNIIKGEDKIAGKTFQTEDEIRRLKHELDIITNSNESALGYSELTVFLEICQEVLEKINLATYTLLFIAMVLSPYIVKLLSSVDLNCLTLWSLTVLYVNTELQSELSVQCFKLIARHHLKRREKRRRKEVL